MELQPAHSQIDDRQDAGNVLEYGRVATRSRRWLRRLVFACVIAAALVASVFSYRFASHWLAVRRGYAKVEAWLVAARTFTIPPGTLLYSENPADLTSSVSYQMQQGGRSRRFAFFTSNFPMLRHISYYAGGEPLLTDLFTIYVHEHRMWDFNGGTKPVVVSVSYFGPDATGKPQFDCMSYDEKASGNLRIPFIGGLTKVENADRPLAHLRIFAGLPNAGDPRRFAIPFECDAGRGRLEFRMDDDVRDGGDFTPTAHFEWDDPPTTRSTN